MAAIQLETRPLTSQAMLRGSIPSDTHSPGEPRSECPAPTLSGKVRSGPQVSWPQGTYQPSPSTEEGEEMAQKINAIGYIECSALTQEGLPEVFNKVIESTVNIAAPKKKSGGCCLL